MTGNVEHLHTTHMVHFANVSMLLALPTLVLLILIDGILHKNKFKHSMFNGILREWTWTTAVPCLLVYVCAAMFVAFSSKESSTVLVMLAHGIYGGSTYRLQYPLATALLFTATVAIATFCTFQYYDDGVCIKVRGN